MRRAGISLAALVTLILAGCGAPDPACADTAVVTWDNFGEAFLVENCQGCHARGAADRHGAPPDVAFDTRADALRQADRILARSAGEDATMPPGGGVSAEDRRRLTAWLGCYEPGG